MKILLSKNTSVVFGLYSSKCTKDSYLFFTFVANCLHDVVVVIEIVIN